MPRGEFIRGDGLVIPNNITTNGAALFLDRAFRSGVGTLSAGLVSGFPTKAGAVADLLEPVGNGYVRQVIAAGAAGWPILDVLGVEAYVESAAFVFPAGNYNQAVNRVMLIASGSLYVALSSPFPADLLITAATAAPQRTFKYRIYWG